jgi:membrane fusion protein (multidrug efflux system)
MTSQINPEASTPAAAPVAPKNSKRKRALSIVALVVIVGGIAWLAYYLMYARWHQDTDDAYVQGNVVSIVPQTSGTVISIDADDGMKVEAGQALVRLDANDAQVAYDQSVANLAGTVRQVRGLYSSVAAGQSNLRAREVAVAQARADVARRRQLDILLANSRETGESSLADLASRNRAE